MLSHLSLVLELALAQTAALSAGAFQVSSTNGAECDLGNLGALGQPGRVWTTWACLDNLDAFGQPGRVWTTWTRLDDLDAFGHPRVKPRNRTQGNGAAGRGGVSESDGAHGAIDCSSPTGAHRLLESDEADERTNARSALPGQRCPVSVARSKLLGQN